jgi:hypothetical protein
MTKFVDYGPVMTAPAPIVCDGAYLFVFALEADRNRLSDLCKSVFDVPSKGSVKCEPLASKVVLIFGRIDKVKGAAAGPAVHEKNVLLHVPVLVEAGGEIFSALFSPFVWVDNPNSMTGGRETFGYAKTYGVIRINGDEEPSHFSLDTFGGDWTNSFWGMRDHVITMERGAKVSTTLFSIMDLVGGIGDAGDLLSEWSDTGVKELFYKQFRSIDDSRVGHPPLACISQIATAEYVVSQADAVEPLAHYYNIQLKKLDSHPFVSELGLHHNNPDIPGYRLRTNFRVEHGRVLWHG